MIRQTHNLVLKDTSESEMARFRQFMLHVVRMQVEEGKATAEWNQFIASEYGSAPENNQPKLSTSEVISKPKVSVPTKSQLKAKPKAAVKKQANLKPINQRGFVIAENGIRLHATPSPYDEAYTSKKGIFGKVYKVVSEVAVIHEDLENKGWYKIRTYDKKEGYIEKQHILILKYNKLLDSFTHAYHYVRPGENFENNIAKTYLKNIPLKTGFDRRNLAQAFFLLNSQSGHSHGITMNDKNISTGDFLELAYKAQYDPTFNQARLNYKTLELKEGHIVRVPNYNYIQLQRKLNTLSSRPDFMNHTIDAGRVAKEILAGMAGLITGVIEGLVMGIYDMLVGIIDSIKQIIETIYDLFTGVLFEKLKNMFLSIIETIKKMTPEEIKKAFIGMLGKAGEHIMAIINNWVNASSFEKGKVIGLVLGNLLLEVLLAIFTGGSANMAKWASKLGKLGKVLLKVADFADDIKGKLKSKLPKKYFNKGVYDKDPDDTKNWMRAALFVQGKAITEAMDASGAKVKELLFALNKSNIYPKLKPKWDATFKQKNVYAISLTASPTKTVDSHFTSGEKDGKLIKGSDEHREQRWKEYQQREGKWDRKRWDEVYNQNMIKARKAHEAVDQYHQEIGKWGKREVTVKIKGKQRRLDIADVLDKRGVEMKSGKYFSLTKDLLYEIERDAELIKQGWDIDWVIQGKASAPLIEKLKSNKINIIFK